MPISDDVKAISLNEGNTPLVKLLSLSDSSREIDVYAKLEGSNPTGSFKDRGMCLAITMAVHDRKDKIICASTGNTSASAAAYAARAGIDAFVIIPDGKIALGKLAQAMMHGAHVIQIEGNFDDGMKMVKLVAESKSIALVNSVNPFRLHGQKTVAFEIIEALGCSPNYHYLPVGNAGNISACWMGYKEFHKKNISCSLPSLIGCQASGAAPFIKGAPIDKPETLATAIRIGNPQSWDLAQNASRESNGSFIAITDPGILKAHKYLAIEEGIFCEPASAVSVAGLIKDLEENKIANGSKVVCTLTGHGLKDPDTAIKQSPSPTRLKADPDIIRKTIFAE